MIKVEFSSLQYTIQKIVQNCENIKFKKQLGISENEVDDYLKWMTG